MDAHKAPNADAFQPIPFRKMNGLGNDFLVVDARAREVALTPERIRTLAARDGGVGFDQFIQIEPAEGSATALMRIVNADGGEVESCGNAARCVAGLLMEETGAAEVTMESTGGLMRAWRNGSAVAVDMGAPRFEAAEVPLADGAGDALRLSFDEPALSPFGPAACVNVGNPHAVFFVPDADDVDLAAVGPQLETHPVFPERANISFVTMTGPGSAKARVWERGVGATKACGTAACAIGAVAERLGHAGDRLTVTLPGGDLQISRQSGRIVMAGPYACDWLGEIITDGFRRLGA